MNEWNAVIKSGGGKTRFYLSNNPNSPVKIFYDPNYDGCADGECNEDNYKITSFKLRIPTGDPECGFPDNYYAIFLRHFGHMVGINPEKMCPASLQEGFCPYEAWTQYTSIFDIHKKVVRALYKVSPGYYVGIE